MGEIKSAIELAMERTKNLIMDDREKEAHIQKEKEIKVRTILRRYLEEMLSADEAKKELDTIEDAESRRTTVVKAILDEIHLKSGNKRLFELLRVLEIDLSEGSMKELEGLSKAFLGQMEKTVSVVQERILRKLRDQGISGDAVEPNIQAWQEWKDSLKDIEISFAQPLMEWRERSSGTVVTASSMTASAT
jgi:hypothetical protein